MLRTILAVVLLSAIAAPAQTLQQHSAPRSGESSQPTGRWLSTHTSSTGIGFWWDFRPDGTLTMFLGPAVTAHVTHTPTTVNVPSGQPGSTITLDYRITGNIMNLKRPGDPDTFFTREGHAPKPSDPLLGRWRPNPPATYSSNPELAARQKAMTTGVYIFHPDDTQTVRIPFLSRTGTWDAATHTFHIEGDAHAYPYTRSGQTLTLGQPPDNSRTETYAPDPLFLQ